MTEQEKGRVEVIGMLRDQEARNSFTPVNNPDKEEWVFSNIEEMAKHTGSEPVLVDEVFGKARIGSFSYERLADDCVLQLDTPERSLPSSLLASPSADQQRSIFATST